MPTPRPQATALASRRSAFAARFDDVALFAAGRARSRNYPANRYPFRASSHFLYFAGEPIAGAAIVFAEGKATLFAEPPDADDALWHGPRPTLAALQEELAFDAVRPIDEIADALRGLPPAATLPPNDGSTAAWLSSLLGREIAPRSGSRLAPGSADQALADAMIALRLAHDAHAVSELTSAAEKSGRAHLAGMRATRTATTEAEVAGAMIGTMYGSGLVEAYGPIVTVHGEVLHIESHDGALAPGDLILADVGGETREGWAADITRVWPVSGAWSPSQRAVYEVVLEANEACIAMVRPGVRYRDVHEKAKRVIVEGMRRLGVLRGDVDGLLERGAASVFFPHGVGHLLGLDVHDMEDLGDRAGYAPGRERSRRFGDAFLRCDRDLAPGMAVTIEPGIYLVPAILSDATITGPLGADLDRDALARLSDVRGIRIEDDVLCTADGALVLTRAVPKDPREIEAVMAS